MSKTKNNFRGNVINTAEKREQAKSAFSYLNLPKGVKAFSVKEGTRKVTFDIIPYVVTDSRHPDNLINPNIAKVGDLWYKRPFKIHRNIGGEDETVICPKSFGKPCPVCEFQKKQFSDKKADPKSDEMKALYAKPRSLYPVIPIDAEDFDDEVCIWDMSEYLFEDILIEELRDDPDNEIFPSLEEGKSLEVTFKWETLGKNTYPKARKVKFVDREPYGEEILDKVPSLDEIFKVLSYKELESKFNGMDLEDEAGGLRDIDEDEEPPVERKSRRKVREEEPEKEVEKPSRRSRRKEVEPEEEEETLKRAPRSKPVQDKEEDVLGKKNPCPHGFVYGVDNDAHDECYNCDAFDDCYDRNREMKK